MREDMNKYNTSNIPAPSHHTEGELSQSAGATVKTMGGMLWRAFKTIFWILAIAGVLVMISVFAIIMSFRNVDPPNISDMKLNYSSFLYLDKEDGTSEEYMSFYSSENRVWVELNEIPDYMKTAQIAIEDHRFVHHQGVDWQGTARAIVRLATGGQGGGGSTLTQQLIKNVTGKNQVSILRKVREIFTALNLEGGYTDSDGVKHVGYSKEEILMAYLNVVNYGGQCQGVQAAAKYYFDKDIMDCTLAECALIAGITQNPWQFNPMIFPEDSKDRARVVLKRMIELSEEGELISELTTPITRSEYNDALAELENMDFVGAEDDEEEEYAPDPDEAKWNDYTDTIFEDVVQALIDRYDYDYDYAVDRIYNAGYEIHSSVDMDFQNDISNYFLTHPEVLPADEAIELAFYMMNPYNGKVMAIVGRRGERHGRRLGNYATGAGTNGRQSGSSIKPLTVYSVGLNEGVIDYGTVLKDEPIPNYFGEGDPAEGPQNFSGVYEKTMNVDHAVEVSQNAPAAWVCKTVSPEACYDFLVNSLHFTSLTEEDGHNISGMALGGQQYGVYLSEMCAGYQIFANGGVYHKPITFDYVKDHDGNVILDNRPEANPGEQVMSIENATIMNKLLHRPTYGAEGTATRWTYDFPCEVIGKTGTTDDNYDLWFISVTPYFVAGIWNGYEQNQELEDSATHKDTWRAVMDYIFSKYEFSGEWVLSDDVVRRSFCRDSGKTPGEHCFNIEENGWYDIDKVPGKCNGGSDHITGKVSPSPSNSPSPSPSPSVSPSPSNSPTPSAEPTPDVTPTPGSEVSSQVSSEVSSTPEDPSVTPAPPPGPLDPTPPPESGTSSIIEFDPNVPAG